MSCDNLNKINLTPIIFGENNQCFILEMFDSKLGNFTIQCENKEQILEEIEEEDIFNSDRLNMFNTHSDIYLIKLFLCEKFDIDTKYKEYTIYDIGKNNYPMNYYNLINN